MFSTVVLQEKRVTARNMAMSPMLEPEVCNSCDGPNKGFLAWFVDNVPWRFWEDQSDIEYLVRILETMPVYEPDWSCENCDAQVPMVGHKYFSRIVKEIEDECKGLCLMCAREDRDSLGTKCGLPEHR